MTMGTMKIFQTHEVRNVTYKASFLRLFIPQSTPMRQGQEGGQQGRPRKTPWTTPLRRQVISLENTLQAPAALEEVCIFSFRPSPFPVRVPQCCSSEPDRVLTFISLNILQSFSVSFRIKSNFQCDRKVPCY